MRLLDEMRPVLQQIYNEGKMNGLVLFLKTHLETTMYNKYQTEMMKLVLTFWMK